MTPQEALYWCEQFTDNIVLVDPQREKMVLALQTMKVCKEALEKQIPKKPVHFEQSYPCCPSCNDFITSRDKKYCDCGQALDWSDAE